MESKELHFYPNPSSRMQGYEIPSSVNCSDHSWFHKRILRKDLSPTNQEAVFVHWKMMSSSHVCLKILILIYVLLVPAYEYMDLIISQYFSYVYNLYMAI